MWGGFVFSFRHVSQSGFQFPAFLSHRQSGEITGYSTIHDESRVLIGNDYNPPPGARAKGLINRNGKSGQGY